MNCEICGRDSEVLYVVIYLGARTYACPDCVDRHGLTVIKKLGERIKQGAVSKRPQSSKRHSISKVKPAPDFELVENYGLVVKRRREELGMTQEDLARKLKVKLSYIKKVEANKIVPEYSLILKLEKILGVKLIETTDLEDERVKYVYEEEFPEGPTLGDLMFRGSEGGGEEL